MQDQTLYNVQRGALSFFRIVLNALLIWQLHHLRQLDLEHFVQIYQMRIVGLPYIVIIWTHSKFIFQGG